MTDLSQHRAFPLNNSLPRWSEEKAKPSNGSYLLSDSSTVSDLPNASNASASSEHKASGLKVRLISAAVGIPIVLLAVLGGVYSVSGLVLAAALIAGIEIAGMARAGKWERLYYIGFATFFVIGGISEAIDEIWVLAVGFVLVVPMIAVGGKARLSRTTDHRLSKDGRMAGTIFSLAAIYFGITLAHAPILANLEDGTRWLLLAILGTFAVDTGAYFTGRSIGRRSLAPKISPKKTWEGVAGGAVAAVGAVIVLGAVLDLPIAVWQASVTGVILAVSGVIGDLFESWLKRRANVKDSGRLIPGHGGILDRIDSLAPNLAVIYWAVQLIGN